jgi:hypothetical protein
MSEQYFTRPNVQPVITYIGTTPEQRQMSTDEFKAKFDEMTVNLQNYIKETLLTELDAFKQDFMTHRAESTAKHIHSSGSNDDGYYTKFDNGLMICHSVGEVDLSIAGFQTVGVFPAQFISTPRQQVGWSTYGVVAYNTPMRGAFMGATTTEWRFACDGSGQGTQTISLSAIGRWK